MESLVLLFGCLGIGVLFRQTRLLPENAYLSLNGLIIYAALPALILHKIPLIPFSAEMVYPIAMPWLVFGLAIPFFILLGKRLKWSRQSTGCLILCCGLGNTSFIGIPVMQLLWGEAGVQVAILADQPGSFAALATAGILVASYFSGGQATPGELAGRVLRFPPFLAFMLALLLMLIDGQIPEPFTFTLARLGSLVVPLALVSVGLQLSPSAPGKDLPKLAWGLGFKLILAPFIIYVLYILMLDQHSLLGKGSVMEAAMGPMITAAIVATNFKLDPPLVGRVVGIGIPLSFGSLFFWYMLLSFGG
ncbi:AEC family transporter [Nafulsella turpanensis]|uniref:AEC family transporter n=1 Tax=Nafulsella turpanensis TaxID=1265690 RepID=UPI00034CC794|nr:AEC family transporter [Nafulsella turpanensis]